MINLDKQSCLPIFIIRSHIYIKFVTLAAIIIVDTVINMNCCLSVVFSNYQSVPAYIIFVLFRFMDHL